MSAVNEFIASNFNDTIRYKPNDEGNLMGLPYPYTTPCVYEGFTEMYYWDTYFKTRGLSCQEMSSRRKTTPIICGFKSINTALCLTATEPII